MGKSGQSPIRVSSTTRSIQFLGKGTFLCRILGAGIGADGIANDQENVRSNVVFMEKRQYRDMELARTEFRQGMVVMAQ